MKYSTPGSWRAAAAGSAVALALLVSACGSEQAGSPTPADSSSAVTSAATSAADSATLGTEESSTEESSTEESSTEESSTEESSTEESTSEESGTEESSTEESTSEESSTAESSTSATTSKPAAKAEPITKPGTKLKLNQAAITEYQTGTKAKNYYQHGTFRTTVVKIVKGDPKIFDQIKNKEDFKDYVPYLIFTQDVILTHEGKTDGSPPTSSIVYGVLKDGTEAGKAIGLATLKGCDSDYFEDASIGAVSTKCTVALAKKGGQPVVGVAFEGDDDAYSSHDDNPYNDNPVVWMP